MESCNTLRHNNVPHHGWASDLLVRGCPQSDRTYTVVANTLVTMVLLRTRPAHWIPRSVPRKRSQTATLIVHAITTSRFGSIRASTKRNQHSGYSRGQCAGHFSAEPLPPNRLLRYSTVFLAKGCAKFHMACGGNNAGGGANLPRCAHADITRLGPYKKQGDSELQKYWHWRGGLLKRPPSCASGPPHALTTVAYVDPAWRHRALTTY